MSAITTRRASATSSDPGTYAAGVLNRTQTTLDLPGMSNSVLASLLATWDDNPFPALHDLRTDQSPDNDGSGIPDVPNVLGARTRTTSGWTAVGAPRRSQHLLLAVVAAAAVLPLTPTLPLRWTAAGGQLITVSSPDRARTSVEPDSADDTVGGVTRPPAQGSSTAVEAVLWMKAVTGMPNTDLIAAARIKPRTWQHWQSAGAEPRVSSQGQLWGLLHSVQALHDELGANLKQWLLADAPRRRELLRSGRHAELVSEAFREAIGRGDYTDADAVARDTRGAVGYYDSAPAGS